jgi:hypothetical protein
VQSRPILAQEYLEHRANKPHDEAEVLAISLTGMLLARNAEVPQFEFYGRWKSALGPDLPTLADAIVERYEALFTWEVRHSFPGMLATDVPDSEEALKARRAQRARYTENRPQHRRLTHTLAISGCEVVARAALRIIDPGLWASFENPLAEPSAGSPHAKAVASRPRVQAVSKGTIKPRRVGRGNKRR